MVKNDIVELEITDFSSEGQGIGRSEGCAVFVKDSVIGDKIKARILKTKKTYAFGRLEEIIEASPQRTAAPCPVARACGGCQIQMMDYQAQLAFKQRKVLENIRHIGGFEEVPMETILGMEEPYHYRNKAQFPVGKNKEGRIVTGFYAGRTHSIIESRDCLIGVEENQKILDTVTSFMEKQHIAPYDEETGKGLVRHIMTRKGFATGQIQVCLVVNGKKLPGEDVLADQLFELPGVSSFVLNTNTKNTNVIFGDKTRVIRGESYIEDLIGDVRYRISARSFYQVNPEQTKKLYDTALEFADLTGKEDVWDLYCGIGTISLFLAQKAGRVRGVEIVPDAIVNAKENAQLNGIDNAEFFVGKAEEVLPEKYAQDGKRSDVIVVDPPRKGCDEVLLNTMLKMQPERIVYVSCDSATLARDLKILCAGGYKLERVRPVDMFPHSVHVETVARLVRE